MANKFTEKVKKRSKDCRDWTGRLNLRRYRTIFIVL